MRTALLALAACAGAAPHTTAPQVKPGAPIQPGGAPTFAVVTKATPPPVTPAASVSGRRRGVPDFAQITGVVIDGAGTRALTKDALGELRIWPALDGSLEPQRVALQAPAAMQITAAPDGSLAAFIDGSGILSLVQFDHEGFVRATATVPPDVSFAGVALLDGGTRVLAARSDQRIALLDASGKELAHLALRAARVLALHAQGDHALALVEEPVPGKDTTVFRVRTLTTSGDALAWQDDGHDLPSAVAKTPQIVTALSPSGTRFGYLAARADGNADVHVVDLATGAEITLDSPATTPLGTTSTLGFADDDHLDLATFGGGSWRVVIDGKTATAISDAQDPTTALPAWANGLRVSAYQGSLLIRREKDGDVEYLGDADLGASTAALAPDGKAVAWTTGSGAVVVQRLDGGDDLRVKGANDWYASVAFADDDHVIAGRNDGRIALLDAHTGAELGSMIASTSTPYFFYDPTTKLLAVMRDTGTVWVVAVDSSSKKVFADPIAVGDGASSFALLDPSTAGGKVLMTIDAQMIERTYSLDTLADGVSAKEMKAAAGATPAQSWGFDRAGESYTLNGTTVSLTKDGAVVATINTPQGAQGVFISPKGDQVGVLEPSATGSSLRVVDKKGNTLWQVGTRASVFSIAWSEDESRAAVLAQGGGEVVDATSGALIATGYGWGFGESNQIPQAFPQGVDPKLDR